MGLTMNEKRSVAAEMAAGYQRARKKEKGVILGQFVELTGYIRRYGARLLREHGKKSRATTIIGDVTKKPVSEYFRELIRQDEQREAEARLESMLLQALESGEPTPMIRQDWDDVRNEVRRRAGQPKQGKSRG